MDKPRRWIPRILQDLGMIHASRHPNSGLQEYVRADDYEALVLKLGAAQAKLDRLMLEYCPEDMTPEQVAEWGKHQRPTEFGAREHLPRQVSGSRSLVTPGAAPDVERLCSKREPGVLSDGRMIDAAAMCEYPKGHSGSCSWAGRERENTAFRDPDSEKPEPNWTHDAGASDSREPIE